MTLNLTQSSFFEPQIHCELYKFTYLLIYLLIRCIMRNVCTHLSQQMISLQVMYQDFNQLHPSILVDHSLQQNEPETCLIKISVCNASRMFKVIAAMQNSCSCKP